MNICKTCGCQHDGSYGSGIFCSRHCQYVYIGKQNKHPVCNWPKNKHGTWKCTVCQQIFETKKLLLEHSVIHKSNENGSWCKGLTKETDIRIKRRSEALVQKYKNGELIPNARGCKLSEEHKKKISESRKKYLDNNPEKVPYVLNHSSKMSYPEQYFQQIFIQNKIDLKYHLQIGRYQLDFYNEKVKKYIEIDGQQHYKNDRLIERDIIRTAFLLTLGWAGIRIRWKTFIKLTDEEKYAEIDKIKKFLEH